MIIAATSDTHGRKFSIPQCDVFIHAGDWTAGGTIKETEALAQFLHEDTNARYYLLIPGNHDRCAEESIAETRALFDSRSHILVNESIRIEGVSFFGSPHTPPFMHWYFMASEEDLAKIYAAILVDTDILITHGPPYGIFDTGYQEPHVGSKALGSAVAHRMIDHHIFGHLHHDGGNSLYSPEETHLETTFHNVAACDDAYNLVRQPIILEI